MGAKKFSKREAIKFGWNTFKSNISFFILLGIVYLLCFFIPNLIARKVTRINFPLGLIFHVADMALTWLMMLGLVKISLDLCDDKKPRIVDLFSQYPLFIKFVIGMVLYLLITYLGMILLIIPGIIWSLKYWFFDYFIVDQGLGPIESLKRSSAITKGAKGNLFVFFFLLLFINIIGALCLLVGLFATLPISLVAVAFVYRKLLEEAETEEKGTLAYEPEPSP